MGTGILFSISHIDWPEYCPFWIKIGFYLYLEMGQIKEIGQPWEDHNPAVPETTEILI